MVNSEFVSLVNFKNSPLTCEAKLTFHTLLKIGCFFLSILFFFISELAICTSIALGSSQYI